MLVRLGPSEISRYWVDIRDTLRYNLLPSVNSTDEAMNKILASMLSEDMQAWALVGVDKGKEMVYALTVTAFLEVPGDETRNLLIYSLYGYHFVPQPLWEEGLEALRKFAKANDCYKIVAYTKVSRMVEIVKSLGGKADYTFLELEV